MSISSSHHPPSPHQASIASRTSRRYIKGTSTSSRRHPVAIASRSNQPPPSYHIGAVPVPLAILFEAAGTGRATEARQIDHGIAQHPKHGHAHAAA